MQVDKLFYCDHLCFITNNCLGEEKKPQGSAVLGDTPAPMGFPVAFRDSGGGNFWPVVWQRSKYQRKRKLQITWKKDSISKVGEGSWWRIFLVLDAEGCGGVDLCFFPPHLLKQITCYQKHMLYIFFLLCVFIVFWKTDKWIGYWGHIQSCGCFLWKGKHNEVTALLFLAQKSLWCIFF